MKGRQALMGLVIGSLGLAIVSATGPASGAEQPAASRSHEMRSYTGPLSGQIGDFTGKLVCLRCDLKPSPDAMKQCQKEGHRHALSMDGDSMIHPLLPGTAEVLEQVNSGELHDKQVTVHGKYYRSTGAILVDRIAPAK